MDWRFSSFLLLLALLLMGFSVAPIQETMCDSKFVLDVLGQHNKDGAANCFDFWLNRYQGLIGVFVTALGALAAVLVGRWAYNAAIRQIHLANESLKQVSIQTGLLASQTAGVRVNEIRKLEQVVYNILSISNEINTKENDGHEVRRNAFRLCVDIIDLCKKSNEISYYVDDPDLLAPFEHLANYMNDLRDMYERASGFVADAPPPQSSEANATRPERIRAPIDYIIKDRIIYIKGIEDKYHHIMLSSNSPRSPLLHIERLRDLLLNYDKSVDIARLHTELREYRIFQIKLREYRIAATEEMIGRTVRK